MLGMLLMYSGIGILFILISLPMLYGRIPPNPIYGFRVPKTLKNPEVWYPVNAHFARRMVWIGIIIFISAIGLALIPGINIDIYSSLMLVVMMISLAIGIYQSYRYLQTF